MPDLTELQRLAEGEWRPDLKPCRCGATPQLRYGLGVFEVVCPTCAVPDKLPARAIAKWNKQRVTDVGGTNA